MYPRWAGALALALCALTATAHASAWQEAHQVGADVDVHVDSAGTMSVRDILRWQVARGPLRWIDLANVDPSATIEPVVVVSGEEAGRSASAHALRRDGNLVRIEVDDPRAFMRGTFAFELHWQIDGLKSGAIRRDGTAWHLAWSSPFALDGFESARTTFVIPAARAAPVAIVADTGAVDVDALSTLRKDSTNDVLELVRPHVGRGEAVDWTIRFDAVALSSVADPHLRPMAAPRPPPEPDRVREVSLASALLGLALGFRALVAHKARVFARACAARSLRARTFAPLPDGLRAAMAGIFFAVGVGVQVSGAMTTGSAFVAAAVLFAALRPPLARRWVRGPGRWLALRPHEAFERGEAAGHWLDSSSAEGRTVLSIAVLLVAGLAFAMCRFDVRWAWMVGQDSAVLLPLFLTGLATDLPPQGVRASASWLEPIFERLRGVMSLRVAPWARIVTGGVTADELRLLILPRVAMPGVVGVEVGRAWCATPAGWAASSEVLVRVIDGSCAAAMLARLLPSVRTLPGRRTDERVIRLRPRADTRSSTVALTEGLAHALTDRRAAAARPWDAPLDRRLLRSRPSASAPPAQHSTAPIHRSPSSTMTAAKPC